MALCTPSSACQTKKKNERQSRHVLEDKLKQKILGLGGSVLVKYISDDRHCQANWDYSRYKDAHGISGRLSQVPDLELTDGVDGGDFRLSEKTHGVQRTAVGRLWTTTDTVTVGSCSGDITAVICGTHVVEILWNYHRNNGDGSYGNTAVIGTVYMVTSR